MLNERSNTYMNVGQQDNELLTSLDMAWLDTIQVSLDIPREAKKRKLTDSFLLDASLSPATRRAEEKRLAAMDRKRLAKKNKKPRDKRKKPWTAKQATARREYKRKWATNPYGCLLHGYGAFRIEKADWERLIAPLWSRYNPEHLKILKRRTESKGTRESPYTIYDIDVVHIDPKGGTRRVVYNGNSQKVYDLSS